jgi:hypothetical protein
LVKFSDLSLFDTVSMVIDVTPFTLTNEGRLVKRTGFFLRWQNWVAGDPAGSSGR